MFLRSVRFIQQLLDNRLLLFISPAPHPPVRVNDAVRAVGDILLLSSFIMK